MGQESSPDNAPRQRQAIAWGAGLFLGIGIGGAIALALDAWLIGLLIAVGITVVVAGIYLLGGYGSAESRADRIAAREHIPDEEDEADDGTY